MKTFIDGETFKDLDFKATPLKPGEYEDCTFEGCSFAKVDLIGNNFINCHFENCDFTLTNVTETGLQEAHFVECKMLGMHFDRAREFLFSVRFTRCQLDMTSYFKCSLKNTLFKDCNLKEADFSEADLTGASFDGCELKGTVFDRTILNKADFRAALYFSINPDKNSMKKTRFSKDGLRGLLNHLDIRID